MAKADDKTNTKRISQCEAVALLVDAYGVSEQVAKELLIEANTQGRTRAFPKLVRDGRSPLRQADPDTSVDLEFWRFDPEVEGNSARKRAVTFMVLDLSGRAPPVDNSEPPLEYEGIEYLLAEVETLLPARPPVLTGYGGAKSWVATKARRLKVTRKIPAGINKTDFSRLLAAEMCEAAKTDPSIRPIMAPSIMNKLDEWGLWPISKIK